MIFRYSFTVPRQSVFLKTLPVKIPTRDFRELFRQKISFLSEDRVTNGPFQGARYFLGPFSKTLRVTQISSGKNTVQVRWQHVEAPEEKTDDSENKTLKSEVSEEKSKSQSDKADRAEERANWVLKKLLSVLGTIGLLEISLPILLFLYLYQNPPEKWPAWMKEILKIVAEEKEKKKQYELENTLKEVEKTLRDLLIVKSSLETMKNLGISMLDSDFLGGIETTLNEMDKKNACKIEELEKNFQKLKLQHETELKDHQTKYEESLKKQEDLLNNTCTNKIETAIGKAKLECGEEISALTKDLTLLQTKLQEAENKFDAIQQDGAAQISGLRKRVELYNRCRIGDLACLMDLHNLLQEKSIIDFPQGHHFSKDFLPLFEEALRVNMNHTASSLKLYGTYIKEYDGIRYLTKGLQENTTIQSLDLGYTDIGSQELRELAKVLPENTAIQELNLSYNYLNDDDATYLMNMLMFNKNKIKLINLDNTYVSQRKKEELKRQLNMSVL